MKLFTDIFLPCIIAFVFVLILVPVLRKLAHKLQLVDKPDFRKVHAGPVPLIGGIAIALATSFSLLISYTFMKNNGEILTMLSAASILLVLGVLDDKLDIKAVYKLIIQAGCAYFIASSGIRITSLYGVFGITTLPLMMQYAFTIIVITGVVNAFNLMDGVDGLAGALATIGFGTLAILSYLRGEPQLTVLYTAFVGALIGFLRFNLGRKKIFMGDGGSLFLGFNLVVSGLRMLDPFQAVQPINPSTTLLIVIGIFLIPVLDSLRVYRSRIKNGDSPFKADRSHLHHLFLMLGLDHKTTSLAIAIATVFILITCVLLSMFFPLTMVLLTVSLGFIILTNLLTINKNVHNWKNRLKDLENR